jgi:hypothetical protein
VVTPPKTNPTRTTTTATRITAPKASPPPPKKQPKTTVAQVDTGNGGEAQGEEYGMGVTAQPQLVSARLLLGTSRVGAGDLDVGFRGSFAMLGTSGALTTFAVRVGVSGDYEITKNIVATATPYALTYSPAKSGMRSDISAVTLIQFMVGVGYRM